MVKVQSYFSCIFLLSSSYVCSTQVEVYNLVKTKQDQLRNRKAHVIKPAESTDHDGMKIPTSPTNELSSRKKIPKTRSLEIFQFEYPRIELKSACLKIENLPDGGELSPLFQKPYNDFQQKILRDLHEALGGNEVDTIKLKTTKAYLENFRNSQEKTILEKANFFASTNEYVSFDQILDYCINVIDEVDCNIFQVRDLCEKYQSVKQVSEKFTESKFPKKSVISQLDAQEIFVSSKPIQKLIDKFEANSKQVLKPLIDVQNDSKSYLENNLKLVKESLFDLVFALSYNKKVPGQGFPRTNNSNKLLPDLQEALKEKNIKSKDLYSAADSLKKLKKNAQQQGLLGRQLSIGALGESRTSEEVLDFCIHIVTESARLQQSRENLIN